MGDVAKIVGGGTPNTSNEKFWNGNINWYSPAEIGENSYMVSSKKKITKLGLEKSSAHMLPRDTVLFTSRAGIGNTAILSEPGTTNQGFQSIVPHDGTLDTYFIFSRTNELKRYGEINGAGSTFLEISGKQLSKMIMDFPSIEEQNTIGKLFKKIDKFIDLQQRELDLYKKLRKGLLQKLFPSDGENVPIVRFADFDEDWKKRKLGEIGKTFAGLSGKTKKDFGHGDAKFVTYMNVFSNPISNPNMVESVEIDSKQYQLKYGNILFTTSSETPEEVGMSSIWLEKAENIYLNSFCFGYNLEIPFSPYYWAFMLRSPSIRKKFIILAQGISRYNISKNKVMDMNVPVTKIEEQRNIGELLNNINNIIDLQKGRMGELNLIKKYYLQKLFV